MRGGPAAGLMGGKGGKESLNDLGLVPQSVLMVKWDDESMNGASPQSRVDSLADGSYWIPGTFTGGIDEKSRPPACGGGERRRGQETASCRCKWVWRSNRREKDTKVSRPRGPRVTLADGVRWLQKGLMKRK